MALQGAALAQLSHQEDSLEAGSLAFSRLPLLVLAFSPHLAILPAYLEQVKAWALFYSVLLGQLGRIKGYVPWELEVEALGRF